MSRTPRSTGRSRARSSTSPTAAPSHRARAQLELLRPARPGRHRARTRRARRARRDQRAAGRSSMLPHLVMPAHHDVRAEGRASRAACTALWPPPPTAAPKDFAELLLVPGVGARTVQALAMVAEVVHGAPCRFTDPARFSLAHGGKDRHPFPVPLKVYDETIRVLKSAVQQREARARRGARRAQAARRSGATAGALCRRAVGAGGDRARSASARISMAAAACSAGSRRRARSSCGL